MYELNNTTEYIGIKELAKVVGKTVQAIRKWCQNDKVLYRIVDGNGGKRYEILISSLEKSIQEKIIKRHLNNIPNGNTNANAVRNYQLDSRNIPISPVFDDSAIFSLDVIPPTIQMKTSDSVANQTQRGLLPLNNKLLSKGNQPQNLLTKKNEDALLSFGLIDNGVKNIIPEEEKAKALLKVDLITKWQNFRYGKLKTKADKEFINAYNTGLLCKGLFKELGKISLRTLYRWNTDYQMSNYNWESLTNNYSYGAESKFKSSLTNIERYLLLKYMLHQNKFSLGRAYELIKIELETQGITAIAGYAAYRRAWEYIKRNHAEKVIFARGGSKALNDTQAPFISRDWSQLSFGEMIVGDGHTLDFMVKNPFTGQPCRMTLLGFYDVASGDLVGYDVMITENTQVIASALRNAIIYMGKIPKVVQLDNGKAFRGKYFTNSKDFKESGMQGLYNKLGIETYFSRAYNGRAKIIERFFKELTESHAKMWGSYIGNNIVNKPAYLMRNEKFHRELQGGDCPTVEDVKLALDLWLEKVYRKRPCRNDESISIAQYAKIGKGQGVDINKLDDLMMAVDERKIGRNGVRLFGSYYWNDKLFGINDTCVIRYNLFDLSFVKVYSQKGEYICKAERSEAVHPVARLLGSPKDYEEYKHQLRSKDKLIKERIKPLKKQLKDMYEIPTRKTKTGQKIKPVETEEQYRITWAENENIINVEKETYEIDYTKFNIPERKEYNI